MIAGTRDGAVGNQFARIEGDSFSTEVVRVDDVISLDGDLCAIFVLIVGFEFTDDLGVGDFFAAVGGYIHVPYDVEVVVSFDPLR